MTTPDAGPLAEARRLHTLAEERGLTVRLLGGAAVALSTPDPLPDALRRKYKDLDYVVRRADAPNWRQLLEANGYTADAQFNALHGSQRLLHYDEANNRQLDTFVGVFAMCHTIDLEDRLPAGSATLAPEDILLTKLQIFEVNDKDLTDAVALLLTHPVVAAPDGINPNRLTKVVGSDWGWYTTISDNLMKVAQRLPTTGLDAESTSIVAQRVGQLQELFTMTPKTLRWRARAKVGRRIPWYDLPEEVE